MGKTLEDRVADFKALAAAESGLEPAEVEEKPEVEPAAAEAADAGTETPEGGKPEGSEVAAPEGKIDAEGRKPDGEVDPAAVETPEAGKESGWKGEIKFRGEVKNLDLTPDELRDVIMHGVNAKTIIAEADKARDRKIDAYYRDWGFLEEDPTTKKIGPSPKGPFNWLTAAFGAEKAKALAAEFAGVPGAGGAGSPSPTEELTKIEAALARLDPDVEEDAREIRILNAEKRAILAEQNSRKYTDERAHPFEEQTKRAEQARGAYQAQMLRTTLTAHTDDVIKSIVKTADPDDRLFIMGKAEALQVERNLTLDPSNVEGLKKCLTDAVKALHAKRVAIVAQREKEAKEVAAKARPAAKSPPPPLGGGGGAAKPPKTEERLSRGHPDYEKQRLSRWKQIKEKVGLGGR